jgi:hypothetical protein
MAKKKPRHLYGPTGNDMYVGSAVCGAESKITGTPICAECIELSTSAMDDVKADIAEHTIDELEIFVKWLWAQKFSIMEFIPAEIVHRYLEQSDRWKRLSDD